MDRDHTRAADAHKRPIDDRGEIDAGAGQAARQAITPPYSIPVR